MNNNYFNYLYPPVRTKIIPPLPRAPIPRISNLFMPTRNIASQSLIPKALSQGARASSLTGITPKISFTQILNGTSKTLGVINQALPIYNQAKPILNNAKTMFRVMKELNSKEPYINKEPQNPQNENNIKNEIQKEITQKKESDTSPTFFI